MSCNCAHLAERVARLENYVAGHEEELADLRAERVKSEAGAAVTDALERLEDAPTDRRHVFANNED